MGLITSNSDFFTQVHAIVRAARERAYRQSNTILLEMYWQVGRLIVEDEQQGNTRATYGKAVLKNLSNSLSVEFGKGFDERNLNNMRAFYRAFRFGTQCVPN